MNKCFYNLLIIFFLSNFGYSTNWKGPDFLVIGTQKGGTTSLYNYLIQHPRIHGPKYKELHFFDFNFEKGIEWYKKKFPKKNKNILIGEATPLYLYHPLVPQRVFSNFPNVKLILLLRDPVERLISYYFYINNHKTILDLNEVFSKELMAQTELNKLLSNQNFNNVVLQANSYLSYAEPYNSDHLKCRNLYPKY